VSPHGNNPFMRGGTLRGEQYIVREATMVDLIAAAYGRDRDRYDIAGSAARHLA